MTRSMLHDANGDLYLDRDGNIAMSGGLAAVLADCETVIRAQLGEMMFAANTGMPTLATAWNNYNPLQFEAAARARLRSVPNVIDVADFTVDRQGGALRYTAVIRTTFGEGAING